MPLPVKTLPALSEDEAQSLPAKELARRYTRVALEHLADIVVNGDSDRARVAAAEALLDRAHGKSVQQQEINLGIFAALSIGSRAALISGIERLVDRERSNPGVIEGGAK